MEIKTHIEKDKNKLPKHILNFYMMAIRRHLLTVVKIQ